MFFRLIHAIFSWLFSFNYNLFTLRNSGKAIISLEIIYLESYINNAYLRNSIHYVGRRLACITYLIDARFEIYLQRKISHHDFLLKQLYNVLKNGGTQCFFTNLISWLDKILRISTYKENIPDHILKLDTSMFI